MAIDDRTIEVIRERFGGEKNFPDLLAALLVANPGGMDTNILPLLLLSGSGIGRGRRSEMLALLAFAQSSQALAQAQSAASATTGGTQPAPAPSTNTALLMALAFGLFGEERELVVRSSETEEPARMAKR
jgi:hypothetical protein